MRLGVVTEQFKRSTELAVQGIRGVTADIKVGTLQRPGGAEGGDDDMAAGTHGAQHLVHIAAAICLLRQKMEHGTVVPNIKGGLGQVHRGDIADAPIHLRGTRAQSRPRNRQRRSGDIQHREVVVTGAQQVIDQHRGPGTDIDDARRAIGAE